MTDRKEYPENDRRHHTIKLKSMLNDTRRHDREDAGKIEDPKAQALFETTAEVLTRPITAVPSPVGTASRRPTPWATRAPRLASTCFQYSTAARRMQGSTSAFRCSTMLCTRRALAASSSTVRTMVPA